MIHYVSPPLSDDTARAPGADAPPAEPVEASDAPPGPISWDLDVALDAPHAPAPPRSWDSVPHPVGPIPEPPALAAPAEARPGPAPTAGEAVTAPPLLATGVHSLGPVGRHRSPVLAFAAAVLTLGVYPVLWTRRANLEMAQFDPRMVVRPVRTAAALGAAVALSLVAAAAAIAGIATDRLSASALPLSAHAMHWLLVAPALTPLVAALVPCSLVALTMTLERARIVEDRAGVDPEHQLSPAGWVWWAAIPVVGLGLHVARAQHRLNRVWDACAHPGRR